VDNAWGDAEFPTAHPVIWINRAVYDLNTCLAAHSGFTLYDVHGIDDHGRILAAAEETGIVLLTPAKRPPEPSE
jgi:hypothetical protein